MPVRKTERRLPFRLVASDLGQHIQSSDGKVILVSLLSSPVVINRPQRYVVLVVDEALANQVNEHHWRIQNGATDQQEVTTAGYWSVTPGEEGPLTISVDLKNSSNQSLATLQVQQQVVSLNSELETLIEQDDVAAPTAGHPETSREVINDVRLYIDQTAPRDLDENSTLNKLIFSITYLNVLELNATQRATIVEDIANGLDQDDPSTFIHYAESGIGLCGIRPYLLAMYLSPTETSTTPLLTKRELPTDRTERQTTIDTLLNELEGLDEHTLIDLFNVLRFPKANLKMCKLLLDGIKTDYYNTQTYSDIITDRSKGSSLITQFKEGPFALGS